VDDSLDQINRAGVCARNLVQQILTFSRREPQALAAQPLGPVVAETLALLRATLPAGVRLDSVLPEAPVEVRCDSTQLQQVLMNLCTNAWHALPEQGGRIEVGFQRFTPDDALRQRVPELPPGACVHLWVRDNGSGMDEATRQRIFDPFFTTKPVGQGTGLGLSVVHGIVRAHDGTIAIDTAPGQGTTFHLYFPVPDAGAAAVPAVPLPGHALPGAGQHVLYIDDDDVMVTMVERLLQRAGFRVTAMTDPAAALALVQAGPAQFDAVVTDFNMPEISGLDVARRVARLRHGLPVVISSGYLSDSLRAQATQAGVRALMQKENTFEELTALLLKLLAVPGP
jgi:CheY-like chemotaxis protein